MYNMRQKPVLLIEAPLFISSSEVPAAMIGFGVEASLERGSIRPLACPSTPRIPYP